MGGGFDMRVTCLELRSDRGQEPSLFGYSKAKSALVFHHLDPMQKDFSISSATGTSWSKIKIELQRCVLLCNRCHAEVHEGLTEVPGRPEGI